MPPFSLSGLLISLGVAAATAAASAAAQAEAARRARNTATDQAQDAYRGIRKSSDQNTLQSFRQADVERAQRTNEAAQLRGLIRVVTGENGIAGSGTAQAIERQAAIDRIRGEEVINDNLRGQLQRISGESRSALSGIAGRSLPSSATAAITGGLEGFGTGLSIGTSVSDAAGLREGETP